MRRLVLVCLVGLLLTACSSGGAPAATQTISTPAAAHQAGPDSLTIDQLKNMQVRLVANDSHRTVQLTDGEYRSGTDPASPDYASVRLVPDQVAFGELNGDGKADAAVLMAENYGGTGVFVSLLAVVNADGQPVQAGAAMIDDRPVVNAVRIDDRKISLAAKIHGPNDPGCCAGLLVTETYGMTKGGLTMLRLASQPPDGTQHAIVISSPTTGAQLPAGPVAVRGTYTVAPFESALTYRLLDAMGSTLAAGSLPTPSGSGAGGTFDTSIDLKSVPAGVLARLEILDVSPADGSTIAMDSVELMIK